MDPFSGWDSTNSRLQPRRGGSLLFTTYSSINSNCSGYVGLVPIGKLQCLVKPHLEDSYATSWASRTLLSPNWWAHYL